MSPDSTLRAFYRDRNLFISASDGSGEIAVTTEGNEEARTKFGIRKLGLRGGAEPEHRHVVVSGRIQAGLLWLR